MRSANRRRAYVPGDTPASAASEARERTSAIRFSLVPSTPNTSVLRLRTGTRRGTWTRRGSLRSARGRRRGGRCLGGCRVREVNVFLHGLGAGEQRLHELVLD